MNDYSEAVIARYEIAYSILCDMDKHEDLPLPNIYRLAKTIQEYFNRDGYFDEVIKPKGWKWQPDVKYWESAMSQVSKYIAKEYRKYFGFLRTNGLKGEWKFMNKAEYEEYLKFSHQDIATRVDNQNDKIESAEQKWQMNIPKIEAVKRLTSQ